MAKRKMAKKKQTKPATVQGWKILTSDFRPPVQGGEPIFDGVYPHTLPTVDLDPGKAESSYGWNFSANLAGAIKIAGLWRTGKPNAMMLVEPSSGWIERGDKRRASGMTLLRAASAAEIQTALLEFSAPFGTHAEAMATEQWLWYQALGRPNRDREAVVAGLTAALDARGLKWTLKEFAPESDARDARDAWAAWAALDAWAALAALDARAARDAGAAWAAWDAWDALDAWAALTVQFAARSGWISHKSELLTTGIRDAYFNGLAIALPTGPNELGWSMDKSDVLTKGESK